MEETIIDYKSTKENYLKEESNLKCNTIRIVDDITDIRLMYALMFKYGLLKELILRLKCDTSYKMCRKYIKDVTIYKNIIIYSW